jgi:hypothetical protein
LQDLASGRTESIEAGRNAKLVTPAGLAHLFEFLEDNVLLEWWDCPYEAWFYKPYRALVDARAAELSKNRKGSSAS